MIDFESEIRNWKITESQINQDTLKKKPKNFQNFRNFSSDARVGGFPKVRKLYKFWEL